MTLASNSHANQISETVNKLITYDLLLRYLNRFNSFQEEIPDQLTQLAQIRSRLPISTPPNSNSIQDALNELIRDSLEQLEGKQSECAKLIYSRFMKEKSESIRHITRRNTGIDNYKEKRFKTEEARLNQLQKKGIDELVEIMRHDEVTARLRAKASMEHSLGTRNYHLLIGAQSHESELYHQLLQGKQDILLITGAGGIGKTSHADKTIRRVIDEMAFYDVIRLDIPSGAVPADLFCSLLFHKLYGYKFEPDAAYRSAEEQLAVTFHSFKFLVFIDGLEDQIDPILEKVRLFTGPTKFILTSRAIPENQTDLYLKPIIPLNLSDGEELFKSTLQRIHTQPVSNVFKTETFTPIFEKVGGNPLAIKLVAILTQQMTLSAILSDLESVEHPDIRELYDRVYARIWKMLNQSGKQILISLALFEKNPVSSVMLLDMNSFEQPDLGLVSITPSQLRQTLDLLIKQSLIERNGSFLDERYLYGLHNLTHSFLRTTIIKWPIGFEIAQRYGQITPLPQIRQGLTDWLGRVDQPGNDVQPQKDVIADLKSMSEIIDWGLYWDQTRPIAVELLGRIWSLLERHGYYDPLEPLLIKAIEYLESSTDDQINMIRLNNRLGEIWRMQGKVVASQQKHLATLKQAEHSNHANLVAETQTALAANLLSQNHLELADQYATQAVEWFEQASHVENRMMMVAAQNSLGLIALHRQDAARAIVQFQSLMDHAKSELDFVTAARIERNIGTAAMQLGELDQAEAAYKRSSQLLSDRSVDLARTLSDLAAVYFAKNRYDQAIPILLEADQQLPADQSHLELRGRIKHNLGFANFRANNLAVAESNLCQAVIIYEKSDTKWPLAESLGVLGEVYLRMRQFGRAVEIYKKALELKAYFPEGSSFVAELRQELAEAEEGLRLETMSPA